ncbi:MAG: hypothetical protein H6621_05205 [Halobacteriovoraceae bacterium]|nr:hypothetical protein [Halobacteriovoraceae bacterium]
MSEDKKDSDPEVEIKFVADKEAARYFKKKEAKENAENPQESGEEFESSFTSKSTYASQIDKIKSKIVFFDYQSEFFTFLVKEIGKGLDFLIVKEFEELPPILAKEKNILLFLNYSAYPRFCQQLIPRIKDKFSHVNMVLVAKNLSAEKVKAHRESSYGVNDYLSFPFSKEDFFRVLLKYN